MTALEECIDTFRRWLHMPEPGALYVVLATVVANLQPGDPAWLMLVGPPSLGKTETMQPLVKLPYVHAAATLTEPALLSGTPKKERDSGARGGLLRQVGDFGILLLKDFTSVLAMNRDSRSQVLAALREIYDGSWTRHVGAAGGQTLTWDGKLGLIAGCTPTIDMHHAVIGAMGERMLMYRLPDSDPDIMASVALAHIGNEGEMRRDLQDAVAAVLTDIEHTRAPSLGPAESLRLQQLGVFATRARTAVERDPHTRDVVMLPQAEGPARFVRQLGQLHGGLAIIGCPHADRWAALSKFAIDCMPAARATVLREVHRAPGTVATAEVAQATGLPTQTARRQLEDLTLLDLVRRTKRGGKDNSPDLWETTAWTRTHWPDESVPETPEPLLRTLNVQGGLSGTLSEPHEVGT